MKKLIALLCAMMMVLSACALAEDDSLQKILDKGTFVLGLDASFPPMGFTDDYGNIVGFDIDVAKEVCNRLGVELVCQPIDWDAKEMELNSYGIDCIWNGMTITSDRLDSMNISVPYLCNRQVVVVRADSNVTALSDLAGKSLALQAGSSAEDALDSVPEFKASLSQVVPYEDNTAALMDLNIQGVDAVLVDEIVAGYYIATMGVDFIILDESLADEEYGIGFRKGDDALSEKVDALLLEMAQDGTLAQISTAWFADDITVVGK